MRIIIKLIRLLKEISMSYIAWLSGRIVSLQGADLVLDVNGVGYALFVPESFSHQTRDSDGMCSINVHTVVREDDLMLFGFMTVQERDLFRVLLKVSGIGPKMALAFLSSFSVPDLLRAVQHRDWRSLTAIKGVGQKAAERLVVELQPQLKRLMPLLLGSVNEAEGDGHGALPAHKNNSAVYEALLKLGYHPSQAHRALSSVTEPIEEEDRMLKKCLQFLSSVS
jgi:holliday junction DNA helicase RuvA